MATAFNLTLIRVEHVTVISGPFNLDMGERFDKWWTRAER